jgi:predicted nucleotidyltransferase
VEDADDLAQLVDLVGAVDGVDDVRLVGSRNRGDPTPLSDWDYEVTTTRFAEVAEALPAAVAPLQPLAAFWDPLGERPNFTVLLDGPVKVDLIFDGHPFTPSPPWVPAAATLAAIDAHFWDWSLWLGAKRARGQAELVGEQLAHLHHHLLAPMGATRPPADLDEAVATYVELRRRQEERLGVTVDHRLGDQVAASLATRS